MDYFRIRENFLFEVKLENMYFVKLIIFQKTTQVLTCADIFRTSEFVSAQRGRYIITLSPKHKASRFGNTNAAGS